MASGCYRFVLDVTAPGGSVCAVLPFNAFAASSGLMDFSAAQSARQNVTGRRAA